MVDYKKTGKYVQTPADNPRSEVLVGIPEQVDYTGKSTRIDDNFTFIAAQIGGPEQYHAGIGLSLDTENNVFYIDTSENALVPTLIADAIATKQNILEAGDNIQIVNNVISAIGIPSYSVVTQYDAGLMSASDKIKLDGIAANANNYSLPTATDSSLGGIIVGDNLTIDNGVLSAVDTTYSAAVPSNNGVGGSAGLLTAIDKEKLNSVRPSANYVHVDPNSNYDGTILIDNNSVIVYQHPAYTAIVPNTETGKVVKGIAVDNLGHVTGVSLVNEAGISVVGSGLGNIITSMSYAPMDRALTYTKEKLGDIQIAVVDNISSGVNVSVTDTLSTVVRKLQNKIDLNNTTLTTEIAKLVEYKGTVGSGGTYDVSSLSTASEGDMYRAVSSFSLSSGGTTYSVVNGDLLIYHNSAWELIPSGEKIDTWRPIKINGVDQLSNLAGSGEVNFKGIGNTTVLWDATDNSIVIETTGSSTGTGNTVYRAGSGLSEVTVSEVVDDETQYITTFSANIAGANTLGSIKIGSDFNIASDGTLSLSGNHVYTSSNGINIVNNDIRPQYGVAENTIAQGNHQHELNDLVGVSINNVDDNQVLKFVNGSWVNSSDVGKVYTAGNHVHIDPDYDIISADDTWREIRIDGTTVGSSDILDIRHGENVYFSAIDSGGTTTLTINSQGGSTGPTYTFSSPLNVTDTTVALSYDTNTLEVVDNQLRVKNLATVAQTGNYNDLTNKPTIPVVSVKSSQYSNVNFVEGANVTLTPVTADGVTTVTIASSGGGGDGITYSAGNGISISGTVIAVKRKDDNSNALHFDENGYMYATDTNTTYGVAANGGLSLTGTDFAVVASSTSNNALTIDSSGLLVKYDNSTIKSGSSGLYVADTSTLVYIEEDSNDQPIVSYTLSSITNNTIYRFKHALDDLTIGSFSQDFSYCTICFSTSGSFTGLTLGNSSWRVIGYDATGSNNVYPLQPNKEYQIAVDNISGSITFYVLRLN